MARHRLRKSDIKALNDRLSELGIEISKKDEVDLLETDNERTYLVNGEPWLFDLDGLLIPHLRMLQRRPDLLKRVTVDTGAVRFIAKGADVMRPGIVAVEDGITPGQLVTVVEETHGKPLAVGKALLDTTGILSANTGKAIRTIHWVGDKRWEA